ncbi:MAG: hypothetical protein GY703_15865 [Gammaproteobacteria bacterium]|nr:hypothetical protein [Gammaproteobacteria bacterium]
MDQDRLRALLAESEPGMDVSRLDDNAVLQQISYRIDHGLVKWFSPAVMKRDRYTSIREGGASPEPVQDEPAPEMPVEEPEDELTWVEIELVDNEGKPATGEAYEVKLPNGETRKGKLGGSGVVRFDDIPKGVCEILFPKVYKNPRTLN